MAAPATRSGAKSSAERSAGRLAGLRVALVFPTFLDVELASHQDNARFLGAIPPLSLGYVAAVLERAGADVLILDCPTLGLRLARAVEIVRGFSPHYVGFTLATVDWSSSLAWIKGFWEALHVPIVVGGIHMECYPKETLSHPCIALGLVGHADLSLVDLLATHQEGGDLSSVPGAVFRQGDGEVVAVPERTRPRAAEEMPFPARHLLPVDKHFSIVSTESRFTAAMSNFGCPFRCEFCILRGDALRQRSATSVVDEMELCYREHGVREIDFFDPVFTLRKDRAMAICDELDRRGLTGLVWSIRARTDTMDEALLDRLWASGCRRIFYGIESGSNAILRRVDKRMQSTEHIGEVVRATKKRGYEILAFVMIGNPLEDRSTVAMTRRMLLSLPVDLVQVASLFPLPKTPIYEQIVLRSGVDVWREHVLTGRPVKPVLRLDTDLDDAEVQQLVTETYMHFYFRPHFAKFALGRLRQPAQLARGVRAATGIARSFVEGARSLREA
jgi:anaerobic magnesium-protoporphyrin IX monomethyl ester cyclase